MLENRPRIFPTELQPNGYDWKAMCKQTLAQNCLKNSKNYLYSRCAYGEANIAALQMNLQRKDTTKLILILYMIF